MGVTLQTVPLGTPVVVGLGDPVMDILANVSAEWLSTVTQEPGGCLPVPSEEMENLLKSSGTQSELVRIPGGSAANVMKGIANITSGSAHCRFVGMVGRDATGSEYRDKLAAQGVEPVLLESSSGAPSACAVCLVTPDGQRTMRTCLGASLELQAALQLPPGWAAGCRLLHAEGYCLYRPKLAREMMSAARVAGAVTSIDLASFELVRNCREALLGLLQDGLIDCIFANEEEAVTLCTELGLLQQPPTEGTSTESTANGTAAAAGPVPANGVNGHANGHSTDDAVEAAQRFLLQHTKVAVTSLGARGCVARGAGGEVGAAPACRVTVQDTIGAGDFFTAGFLSAYLQGGSLQQCCAAGCAAGCEAVQAVGAELPREAFVRLQGSLARILATRPVGPGGAAAAAVAGAIRGALAGRATTAVGPAAAVQKLAAMSLA